MQCPYCAEEIRDQAIVCKHCRRDLIALKPLMEANAALKTEVEDLRRSVATLQASGPMTEAQTRSRGGIRIIKAIGWTLLIVVMFVIAPIIVLVGIHYLFVIKLDLSTISLRLASILVPAVFGVVLAAKARQGVVVACLIGAVVGLASVAGMLTVVGLVDKVPIIPANSREWQEAVEYAFSIMLATVTGALAGRVWLKFETASQMQAGHGDHIYTGPDGSHRGGPAPDTRTDRMMRVEMLITAAGAIATAAGSLIAGLKGTAE